MKKLITKIHSFSYRLIYGEATAIETMMFGIILFIILFTIIWAINPKLPQQY